MGATGGRASGHFELAEPYFFIQAEQYSFTALSTGGYYPNAKGELDAKITRSTLFQDLHAEVDCLVIAGNQAWISGPLKRLLYNGVPQPTANRYVVWRVQDNGEGANSPPDVASVLYVGFPQACMYYYDLDMTPNANMQVSQK